MIRYAMIRDAQDRMTAPEDLDCNGGRDRV